MRAAQNSLCGKFYEDVGEVLSGIVSLRAELESIINFPEDDDTPDLITSKISDQIKLIIGLLEKILINSMNSNHTTALTGVLEKIVFFNDENSYCIAELSINKTNKKVTILGKIANKTKRPSWITINGITPLYKEIVLMFSGATPLK